MFFWKYFSENLSTHFLSLADNRAEKLIRQEEQNSLQKAASPGAPETFTESFQENQYLAQQTCQYQAPP